MRSLGIITVFISIILVCPVAFGASLSYAPESNYVTIAAGSEQSIPMSVTLSDGGVGTYYLWFADETQGDIPLDWLTASPSTAFLSKWWPTASTSLKIKVPEGTASGTYSVYLASRAKRSHIYADPGDGMYIEVYVPADCGGKPEIEITSFGPEVIWPPNHSTEVVTVSGKVIAPSGCTIFEAGYSVDDEYGIYTGVGSIQVATDGGSFTAFIPVEASREGGDKDGRLYTITLYAEDEIGIGTSQTLDVLVPHDQRDKMR